jgi:hypothetical protein
LGKDEAVSWDTATSLRPITTPYTMNFIILDDMLGGMQTIPDSSSSKKL